MLILKRVSLFKPRFGSIGTIFSSSSFSYIDRRISEFLYNQSSEFESLLKHHGIIITTGNSDNVFIASKLISSYASFEKANLSTRVFDLVNRRDGFLWNSIIKAHFSNGDYRQALGFFFSMLLSGQSIDQFTTPMVVSSCAELLWEDFGCFVHGLVLKHGGFERDSAVGASFVYFYTKCGGLKDARQVFDEMSVRDVVAWTAIISGHVQNGENERALEYLSKMQSVDSDTEKPNSRTLECGFQACINLGALNEGKCLHSFAMKQGLSSSNIVQSSVFSLYSKCGNPIDAYLSFRELSNGDMYSWTSIIASLARSGNIEKSFDMFWEMQSKGLQPDGIVLSCLVNEFGKLMLRAKGKAFHGIIIRHCWSLDDVVCNSLLSMYCKFELLSVAEKLFLKIREGNNEAWNTMIKGYGKMKYDIKCIELFKEIQNLGIEIELSSFASVISSCSHIGDALLGKSLHSYVVKCCLDHKISVINSLIDFYGKIGDLAVAWKMFSEADDKNTITWNIMIASYVHCEQSKTAFSLFDRMTSENFQPNSATLVTLLTACTEIGSLEKGEMIHQHINEKGYEMNLSLTTSLINMYSKCGRPEKSRELFDSVNNKDTICWNAMISGYGMHGNVDSAINLFNQMEKSNAKPTETTFLALLTACAHAGLVEQGKNMFRKMNEYNVKPSLKHYSCMVDLLARSGDLKEAEEVVMNMPMLADGVIWGSLLSSCMMYNEFEMGIKMAKCAISSDPENDGYYVMLANVYSAAGKWELAEMVREMMKEKGVEKRAGHSLV